LRAFRSSILHFLDDPATVDEELCYQYFEDGMLVVADGQVKAVGATDDIRQQYHDIEVIEYPNSLIVPGFIDTHIHYPQTDIIAAYGDQLPEWLENYAFPAESEFSNRDKAAATAEIFLDELLRNGTTTALVFGTVHRESVDAFFTAAQRRKLRMICGKVLMDRNAPEYLRDTPQSGYRDSKELIERWHGKDRLLYAVTPRFAPTSSHEQLSRAGDLLTEYPGVFMHTHLSENIDEVRWVQDLFPESAGYLDVYDRHHLLGRRSVFAHGIHLEDKEYQRLHESDSGLSFCPTSNLFLGSGLFNLDRAEQFKVNVGLGTDVGAGTSFSLLQTINEAYKVQQLRKRKLSPLKSLYLATLGGARTLDMDAQLGNFLEGKEADFAVLDYASTPLIDRRIRNCKNLFEKLFVLTMLGDDRSVKATYALGNKVHERDS